MSGRSNDARVEARAFGSCPVPAADYERIVLGHGSGGRLGHELFARVFRPLLGEHARFALEDQAVLELPAGGRLALNNDAFVIDPLVFPGGDIGDLAVYGTVNDLAVGGARPLYLTATFILEEGLPLPLLQRVVGSMRRACAEASVGLVAGDTKVVERGKCDGMFITTSGVGVVDAALQLSATAARPGDQVLLSGTLGDHGIAILAAREGIELETALHSDCAPLTGLVADMLAAARARPGAIRCMRDPTRGGLSSALNEIAAASRVGVALCERDIPLRSEVRGACELLGFDPLYVANEGKLVAIVAADAAEDVLAAMRAHRLGRDAAIVGEVLAEHPGVVTARSPIGGERVVAMLQGEQLPRIC